LMVRGSAQGRQHRGSGGARPLDPCPDRRQRIAGHALVVPRGAGTGCGGDRDGRCELDWWYFGGPQDRQPGGDPPAPGDVPRLHGAGRALLLHAPLTQRAERPRPGDGAGVLPRLVRRTGDVIAADRERDDRAAAGSRSRDRAPAGPDRRCRGACHDERGPRPRLGWDV
ncbi:MAG: Gluconate dehydratase, partial [uncultured Thermomicrobiales bacterium]